MKIDVEKLISLIAASPFGTGTLASAARVPPDELQCLIGRASGEEKLIERFEGLLGDSFRIDESPPQTPAPPKPPHAGAKRGRGGDLETSQEPGSPLTSPRIRGDKGGSDAETAGSDFILKSDERSVKLKYRILAQGNTIEKLKYLVRRGDAVAELLLKVESEQVTPRKTLVSWLQERIKMKGNANSPPR